MSLSTIVKDYPGAKLYLLRRRGKEEYLSLTQEELVKLSQIDTVAQYMLLGVID
jgi:hypothetical protein